MISPYDRPPAGSTAPRRARPVEPDPRHDLDEDDSPAVDYHNDHDVSEQLKDKYSTSPTAQLPPMRPSCSRSTFDNLVRWSSAELLGVGDASP
ncbi:hypothetical protein JCM8208_002991 [Rhodotorula glutinis]